MTWKVLKFRYRGCLKRYMLVMIFSDTDSLHDIFGTVNGDVDYWIIVYYKRIFMT